MEYLTELIALENEWKDIKISGEEYAKTINENPEMRERKKNEILAYQNKLLSSNLITEEKERRLKEIRENLGYLENNSNNPVKKSDDSQLLLGVLLGGLVTVFGMYFIDQLKNYLTKNLSEGILNGLYGEKQRI